MNGRQVDDEDAILELIDEGAGDFQGEARLTCSAWPGQGQQAHGRVVSQQMLARELDFVLTPEERRGLNGQIVFRARTCVRGRGLPSGGVSHCCWPANKPQEFIALSYRR